MAFVALYVPTCPTAAAEHPGPSPGETLPAALLTIAPHVVTDRSGLVWVDARGLDLDTLARQVAEIAQAYATTARVGAASTAIAAGVAALHGPATCTVVLRGTDAGFLALFALTVLAPAPPLAMALGSVGVDTCGDLARLTQEAVEVRFGAEGVALWRLARADDPRRIFTATPRTQPAASLAWEDHLLRDTDQLLFVANRLLTTICADLHSRGIAARALTLSLTLADRAVVVQPIRTARATANRVTWMRLIRRVLERLRLADGVVGIALTVDAAGPATSPQGDVFDRGFQTAGAVQGAVARLQDDGAATVVEPVVSAHPLPDQRVRWQARTFEPRAPSPTVWPEAPRLVLQVFPEPPHVEVTTALRRGDHVPVRFRAPGQPARSILTAIGPDRVSGDGTPGQRYARAYFTCLTDNGLLVLLFHDVLADVWYLQGWWD